MPSESEIDAFYLEIGERVRGARLENNRSQRSLAEGVRMSRASIGNIEAGRQRIQVHTLATIGHELGCSLHRLLPSRIETESVPGKIKDDSVEYIDSASESFVLRAIRQASNVKDSG